MANQNTIQDEWEDITPSQDGEWEDITTQVQTKDPSAYERVMELPGAANRSFLQGTGYQRGAENFRTVPRYADLYGQSAMDLTQKIPGVTKLPVGIQEQVLATAGYLPRIAGTTVDMATNPADLLMALGLEPAALGIEAVGSKAIRGADKNITSILDRISGGDRTNIKQLRDLESKYGRGYVLNKTKSKPGYLGNEIAPKAADLASNRVRSLEPEALSEIGIDPQSIEIAKNLKQKFNMESLPTQPEADQMFKAVIDSAPDDINIDLTNFEKAFSENASKLHPREAEYLKRLLNRTTTNELGQMVKTGISKAEFQDARGLLNDMLQGGDNFSAQAMKSALDTDAEAVIQGLSEAKGAFQLSRELPKAQRYLDKPRLEQNIQGELSKAVEPENPLLRKSMSRLLGKEGESLIDNTNAQRLSKVMYSPSNISTRPLGNVNNLLDLIRLPGRFLQRGYEGVRSGLLNKGVSKTSGYLMKGEKPFSYNIPKNTPNYKPSGISMSEVASRVKNYKQPTFKVSPKSEVLAQEQAMKEAIARGEIQFQGTAGEVTPPQYQVNPPYGDAGVKYQPQLPTRNKPTLREIAKKIEAKRKKR